MNGPEHYREAERLLALAESVDWQDGDADRPNRSEYASVVLKAASVHTALAQVAAIANLESGESSTSLAETPSGWDGAQGDRATWSEVLR